METNGNQRKFPFVAVVRPPKLSHEVVLAAPVLTDVMAHAVIGFGKSNRRKEGSMTQQQRLATALKRRWLNAGGIVELLGSTCPHKRVSELKSAGYDVRKRESKDPAFVYEYRIAA